MSRERRREIAAKLARPNVHVLINVNRPCFCPACGQPLTDANTWFDHGIAFCRSCCIDAELPIADFIARVWHIDHILNVRVERGLTFFSPHFAHFHGYAITEIDQHDYDLAQARRDDLGP